MKNETYRSAVFSILKIQFGWGSFIPDGCNDEEWEQKIEAACINNVWAGDVALCIADDINDNGGSFLERSDGKPNFRVPTRIINNFIKNDRNVGSVVFKTLEPVLNEQQLDDVHPTGVKQINKAQWIAEYKKTLGNLNSTVTQQQIWKTFYRAHRLVRAGCEEATSLCYSIDNLTSDNYYSDMLSCVCGIFFPRVIRSASDIHRSHFRLSNDAIEKFWNAGPSCLPSFEKSDVYDYADEIPF